MTTLKYAEQTTAEKTIEIKTARMACEKYLGFAPGVRGFISCINFSVPLKDFRENENNFLALKSAWFLPESNPCWETWIDGQDGKVLVSKGYNKLSGRINDYSISELRHWLSKADKAHRNALSKLEDFYWQGKPIDEEFLERIIFSATNKL